jgi:superoxide reductase
MKDIGEIFQTADWKKEKHVPVIEAPEKVKQGEAVRVNVMVGREIAHPNTSEHHIAWIDVYFLPEGEKYPGQLGRFEFKAHGASIKGPDTSTIYTGPGVDFTFKTEKPGTIIAFSYCNIHGLWSNIKDLQLV